MRILFKGVVANVYSVQLSGEFDACGCKEIRSELEAIVDDFPSEKMLCLDLYDVDFIDSSGVGAIVFLFKRIQTMNGSMEIIRVHGQPQELLSLLRVDEAISTQWLDTNNIAASSEG